MTLAENPRRLVADSADGHRSPTWRHGGQAGCLATGELRAGDRTAVLELFSRSSPQTRFDRFHHPLAVMPRRYLDDLVSRRQLALVARDECCDDACGRIVGLASAANLTPTAAEVAVWVEDRWQGHGIGSMLTHTLLDELAVRGVSTAVGVISPGNQAVRRFIARVCPQHSIRYTNGLLVAEMPLGPARTTR